LEVLDSALAVLFFVEVSAGDDLYTGGAGGEGEAVSY